MADLITLSQTVIRHHPERIREEQAKADAIIEYASHFLKWREQQWARRNNLKKSA